MTTQPTLSDKSVLYVEDEVIIALVGTDTIKALGFKDVKSAFTKKSALKALDQDRFDLAVLDVNLGNGDTSFDVARRVKEAGGKVVFTTGYTDRDTPDDLVDEPVVIKPFHADDIKQVLSDIYGCTL